MNAMDQACSTAPLQDGLTPLEGEHKERRMIFVDDRHVAEAQGVSRVFHAFRKDPDPVLVPEYPWEHNCVLAYASVFWDDAHACFRLYYKTYNKFKKEEFVCYAESLDLQRWTKPEMDLAAYGDHGRTNIVPGASSVVLTDPLAPPEERYRCLTRGDDRPFGPQVFASADGFRFSPPEHIFPKGHPHYESGDRMAMGRAADGTYLIAFKPEPSCPRRVCVTHSPDFHDWSEPVLALEADQEDPPQTELYGMTPFVYAGQWLGFLEVFHVLERRLHTQLVVAEGPQAWKRCEERHTLLQTGAFGAFDSAWAFPSFNPPLRYGEELLVLYSGRRTLHWGDPPHGHIGRIGLARLRLDGFASLSAPETGMVTTQSFPVHGPSLVVNANAQAGAIEYEILAEDGRPIPGYTRDECYPVTSDATYRKAVWAERDSLDALSGQKVRVRLFLKASELYSLCLSTKAYDQNAW